MYVAPHCVKMYTTGDDLQDLAPIVTLHTTSIGCKPYLEYTLDGCNRHFPHQADHTHVSRELYSVPQRPQTCSLQARSSRCWNPPLPYVAAPNAFCPSLISCSNLQSVSPASDFYTVAQHDSFHSRNNTCCTGPARPTLLTLCPSTRAFRVEA